MIFIVLNSSATALAKLTDCASQRQRGLVATGRHFHSWQAPEIPLRDASLVVGLAAAGRWIHKKH